MHGPLTRAIYPLVYSTLGANRELEMTKAGSAFLCGAGPSLVSCFPAKRPSHCDEAALPRSRGIPDPRPRIEHGGRRRRAVPLKDCPRPSPILAPAWANPWPRAGTAQASASNANVRAASAAQRFGLL